MIGQKRSSDYVLILKCIKEVQPEYTVYIQLKFVV